MCKKKCWKNTGARTRERSELQPFALSARPRLLLVSVFYELCNMVHTKTLNNNFLQIIDIGKNWFKLVDRKMVEVVYSATYWKFSERIEDVFSLQIHDEKTLAASRLAPSTRRHTDSRSVSVCEAVSGRRCLCVRKNRARALGLDMLHCSSLLVENRAHTDVIGFRLCASTGVWQRCIF